MLDPQTQADADADVDAQRATAIARSWPKQVRYFAKSPARDERGRGSTIKDEKRNLID